MLKPMWSVGPQAGVFLQSMVKKIPHFILSYLVHSQRQVTFFFLSKSKRSCQKSQHQHHVPSAINWLNYCSRTPDSTNLSNSSAEPFAANSTPWAGRAFLHRVKEHLVAALQGDSLHLLYHTSTPAISLHYFIFLSSDMSYYELWRSIA